MRSVKSDSRLNNVSECMKRPCLIPNSLRVWEQSLMDFRLCGQTVTDSLMLISGPTQSFSHSLWVIPVRLYSNYLAFNCSFYSHLWRDAFVPHQTIPLSPRTGLLPPPQHVPVQTTPWPLWRRWPQPFSSSPCFVLLPLAITEIFLLLNAL